MEKEGEGKEGEASMCRSSHSLILFFCYMKKFSCIPEKNFIPKLSNCRSSKPESENGHFCTLLEGDTNVEGDHTQSQL